MSYPEFSSQSNFDFHLTNIKSLLEDTIIIKRIPNFSLANNDEFYTREDRKGWWMATKQIVIRQYIEEYLTILGKEKWNYIDLFFIDLLGSFGMNKVTKSNGSDEFIFPGSSVSAALISTSKVSGFKKLYTNDFKCKERTVLNQRLNAFKYNFHSNFDIEINLSSEEIDSNIWSLQVLNDIKKNNKYFNYLMIIDNEGMNIKYDTLKEIRSMNNFGDIIINFQDTGIIRNLKQAPLKVREFFGKDIPISTKKEEICDIYVEQLNKIGLNNVEKLRIASDSGFYYTLLFCCRSDSDAKWLKMIKFYRDERFKNWTDSDVKKMWDVAKGKVKSLDQFIKTEE